MTPSKRKASDSTEPPDLSTAIKKYIYRRLGRNGYLLLLLLSAALSGVAWLCWEWETIKDKPVIGPVVRWISREALPVADRNLFTIAILHLEGDRDGTTEDALVAALRDLKGVGLLRLDRNITLRGAQPKTVVQQGHAEARSLLDKTGAQVMLWGQVLTGNHPRLYWTLARAFRPSEREADRIALSEDLELPDSFLEHLSETLTLLTMSTLNDLAENTDALSVDQLRTAIRRVEELLDVESPLKPNAEDAASIVRLMAEALLVLGDRVGDRQALQESIELYRTLLAPKQRPAGESAALQARLGIALGALGEMELDDRFLREAIGSFDEALTVFSSGTDRLTWALVEVRCATVKARLGERTRDLKYLEEAEQSYESALSVFTREEYPLDWARTQDNLGIVRKLRGEMGDDPAMFEKALGAYELALLERTRQAVPISWARTKNNLGNALLTIARMDDTNTIRLEEAIARFKEALSEHALDRAPRLWASIQRNLGIALMLFGERTKESEPVVGAVMALRAALSKTSREGDPVRWARTQMSIGAALTTLGRMLDDRSQLEKSVDAYLSALAVYTPEAEPDQAAAIQATIGELRLEINRLERRSE